MDAGYYTGRVSNVDKDRGMVKVTVPNENNTLTDWLPMLEHEYHMPKVGDYVSVSIGSNKKGVCFGRLFSNTHEVKDSTKKYQKNIDDEKVRIMKSDEDGFEIDMTKDESAKFNLKFNGGAFIKYDGSTLTLQADNIILNGYKGR